MSIFRQLALLFAGALASIVGGAALASFTPVQLMAFGLIIIIVLVTYASGVFSCLNHKRILWRRKHKKVIGIINDMGTIKEENSSWTDVEPSDWRIEIEQFAKANSCPFEIKLVKTHEDLTRFIAIVNPYGGVLPEKDALKPTTLDKVLQYVNEGGIWLNVADVPGYYSYDISLDRILPAPRLKMPFELVPFIQKLGLQIYPVDCEEDEYHQFNRWDAIFERRFAISENRELVVRRVAVVENRMQPIIQSKGIPGKAETVTPVFLVKKGTGQCMISLPPLDINHLLKDKLVKILFDVLKENYR